MSIKVSEMVWKARGIKPMGKLVLLKLADHADDQGRCHPGLTRIASDTGLGRNSVVANLDKLMLAGWLEKVAEGGAVGRKTNRYQLNLEALESSSGDEPLTESKGGGRRTSSGDELVHLESASSSGDEPQVVREMNPNRHKPSRTVRGERKDRGTLEEFKVFAQSIGLRESDGESMFYGLEANGWMRGKSKIKCWRSHMRTWKTSGYHPSQKAAPTGGPARAY